VLARENVSDHAFEPVGPFHFEIETGQLEDIGHKFRMMGKYLFFEEFRKEFDIED
jgi:hypothetical protein